LTIPGIGPNAIRAATLSVTEGVTALAMGSPTLAARTMAVATGMEQAALLSATFTAKAHLAQRLGAARKGQNPMQTIAGKDLENRLGCYYHIEKRSKWGMSAKALDQ